MRWVLNGNISNTPGHKAGPWDVLNPYRPNSGFQGSRPWLSLKLETNLKAMFWEGVVQNPLA